jgi:hypothetical protein
MNYINEIRHLRFLAEDARRSTQHRNQVIEHLLDNNYDLLNLRSWLEVCRTEAATDYCALVGKGSGSDAAYDTLKVLQAYDNDHRTLVNAMRDLAYLLIKYKNEVQKEYRPAEEIEEPAWMKDV